MANENSGSIFRVFASTFTINNHEDIKSSSSAFIIDIQAASTGAINNFGVINGNRLIRSRAPFDGIINNEGTLNAASGTVIDFSASSALNLENSGIIRGDIIGSTYTDDAFTLNDGLFSGDVYGIEQVIISGDSSLSGTFNGTLQFRNSGSLSTDGLSLNQASYVQTDDSALIVALSEENLTQPVISARNAEFSSGSTLSLEPDFYVLSREQTASYKVLLSDHPVTGKEQLSVADSLFFEQVSISGNNQEVNVTLAAKDIDDVLIDSGLSEDSREAYGEAVENVINEIKDSNGESPEELERWLSALTDADDKQELSTTAKELKPSTNGSTAFLPMQFSRTIHQNLVRQSAKRFRELSYGDNPGQNLWGMTHFTDFNHRRQKKNNGAVIRGYKASGDGLTLGYDQQWSEQLLAGAAFSYGNSKTRKNHSPDNLKTQSYQLSLYGQKRWSDWSMTTIVSAGIHRNTQHRFYEVNNLGYARGRFDSQHHGLALLLEKSFQMSGWLISPQVSLNYLTLDVDSYTESGDLNYRYDANTHKQLELGLGVAAGKRMTLGKHLLDWELSAMARHDFKADKYRVKTAYAFVDQASWFTSEGARPDKNAYEFRAGCQYTLSDQLELELSYIHAWSAKWYSHSGSMRLIYAF